MNFCEHQLELMEYTRNALTTADTFSWIEPDGDSLPVPGLSARFLGFVHDWTKLASRVEENRRRLRYLYPIQMKAPIMENGCKNTGYKFVYLQPKINEVTTWTEESTGIAQCLLEWADKAYQELSTTDYFQLLNGADFMGAKDMLELLACRLALEMIQGRMKVFEEAEKMKVCRQEYLPTANKLKFFKEWLDRDDVTADGNLHHIKSFFRELRSCFTSYPRLRNAILSCQNHGWLPVPRETWTEHDWADFKEQALAAYLTLPTNTV